MASEKKKMLPWGLSEKELKPNSVQELSQTKLKAFAIGKTVVGHKSNPFQKKKEEKEEKKKVEAKEAAKVFEEFVASFQDASKAGKTFIKGTTINPDTKREVGPSSGGMVYKPTSTLSKTDEKSDSKPPVFTPLTPSPTIKPVKKTSDKKRSILELLGEEFKRMEEERMERQSLRDSVELPFISSEMMPDKKLFKMEEAHAKTASFDSGDPLSTNLYVGNISPKMNEEMLCQHFGQFGPLASVKIMWPRTEEEKTRNRNCGFVAFMKRPDADRALQAMKGSTIMGYEVQIGWGKSVPLPPTPFYMTPAIHEEKKATLPDPPSGLPFNAHPMRKSSDTAKPDKEERFEDALYNAVVRVVVPSDFELLKVIHRMIEFVIREGPMFEAIIMNKEINNPKFKFLFDNQCPAHTYYRWKLFSLLQGDSPETWNTNEFRMFENGSLWKPPQLKNLRGKVLPPITEIVKKGQLSLKHRDELEDRLRAITMERSGIRESMVWCLDHAESADEIVECMYEALTLTETPLPLKIARLYLVNDILQNSTAHIPNAAHFRTRFEGRMIGLMEHLHSVLASISSRIRAESFKRRVLRCLQAWDHLSVFHFNYVDKLRDVFIGKTIEEMEKKKAFETVAALMSIGKDGEEEEEEEEDQDLNGLALVNNRPIDFSGGAGLDGEPMDEGDDIDGVPFIDPSLDGVPITEDIDGVPMGEQEEIVTQKVQSKWELVDYGNGSSDEQEEEVKPSTGSVVDKKTSVTDEDLVEKKRQLLREVELKVMELEEALESSGSYSKKEVTEKANRFRERLLQEATNPGQSNQDSPIVDEAVSHNSPQSTTLAVYDVSEGLEVVKSDQKEKKKSREKDKKKDKDKEKTRSREKESKTPSKSHSHHSSRSRSRSPISKRRRHGSSPSSKRNRSRSRERHRSRSPHSSKGRDKHSRSPRRSSSSRSRH